MTPSLLDTADPRAGEQPNEQAQPDQSSAPAGKYGVNNRDLPEQLKNAIIAAIKEAQQQEKYVRRSEILQDAQHRFYDLGVQHIYQGKDYCFVQAQPGGTYAGPNGNEAFGEYIDDYDIFHPFALIQQAKLSENMPGIDFQPVDPNKPEDIEAASAAEGMRHEFDRNNDVKEIQKEITYHLQMGGRVVMWTRTENTEEKFGDDMQGRPQRTSCTSLYGVIEAKVPIFANKRKDFWYCILYDDPDIKTARTDYPWIADKISAGRVCLEENAYERIARLGVIQGSQGSRYEFRIGDSIAHLISRGNCFLRLSAFEAMKEAYTDPDGAEETTEDPETGVTRPLNVKEKLAEVFPGGVHACIVGDQYAESWNRSMDDCISVGHAFIGKGQSRMPIMKSMVVVQDRFNSSMNYSAENFDYGAPSIWVSCGPQEFAAIKKQRSSPWAFRNLKDQPAGSDMSKSVYREPGPELPKSFQEYIEYISGALPQFQLAVPPSIWGEAMKDQKTASGYQLAASQAMGILGVFWTVQTQLLAHMYYHNCLAIMDDPDYPDKVTVPNQGGKNIIVKKESLTKGNFRAYPDTESGFPETTAAKRGTLTTLITQLMPTPLAPQIFGAPDNISFMLREYGLTEMVLPEAEAREKQLREIESLLNEPPRLSAPLVAMVQAGADMPTVIKAIADIGKQMAQQEQVEHAAQTMAAQASGQPPPPPPPPFDPSTVARSSVPVWESDYHQWEAGKCRDWLSSDERNNEEAIGRPGPDGEIRPNVLGVLNVFLHWKEHMAMAALEPAPAMGPLPPPNVGALQKLGLQVPTPPPAIAAPAPSVGV